MSDCESTRGTWGQTCPDCSQLLPSRKPFTSWRAGRLDVVASERSRVNSGQADRFRGQFTPRSTWRAK